MKNLLIILCCVISFMGKAQTVQIDQTLKDKYDKLYLGAYNYCSERDKKYLDSENVNRPWIPFLVTVNPKVIDTLNRQDFPQIPPGNFLRHSYIIMFSAVVRNDTLIIDDMDGGIYKVKGNQYSGIFKWDIFGKVFRYRTDLSAAKTAVATVPLKTASFKLSTLDFKIGDVIYGEVDYTSDPFYVDDTTSVSGYLERQFHVAYVFKITLRPYMGPAYK